MAIYSKNGSWKTISKIFAKNGTWKPVKRVFIKINDNWRAIWPTLGPYTTESPKIRLHTYRSTSSAGTQPPTDVSTVIQMGPGGTRGQALTIADGETGSTYLWGYDGTWANNSGATITRNFYYGTTYDITLASIYPGVTDQLPNTSTDIGTLDNYYVFYKISETTSSGTGADASDPLYIIKQKPIAPTYFFFSSPGTAEVGTAITLSYSLDSTWYRNPDLSKSYIEWFAEDSTSSPLLNSSTYISGSKIFLNSISSSYASNTTFTPTSLQNNKYIYAKITLVNSYSDYYSLFGDHTTKATANTTVQVVPKIIQKSGTKRTIYTGYTIGTSQTFYVGTNGYIGYNNSSSSYSGPSLLPTGTFLNLFGVQDLVQSSLYYNSTDTSFTIDWSGYKYNDTNQNIEYYATFYWNSDQVDVYFATNNMTSNSQTSDAAIIVDGATTKTWSSNSSSLSSYTLPSSLTFVSSVTSGSTDDGYTTLNAAKPVAKPTISSYPTISRDSSSSYSFSVTNGSWNGNPTSYRYQWYTYQQTSGANYSYFPISGATSSTFDASSYKLYYLGCVVWATNSGGESNTGYGLYSTNGVAITSSAGGAGASNTPYVYYKSPTVSLTASSPAYATLRYNYSVLNDDTGATIVGQYKLSSSSTWTNITLGSQNTNIDLTLSAGTYDFRISATNTSTYGNSYQDIQTVTNIVVQATPLPQYFDITSATKAYPSGGKRTVNISWQQSTNANKYEIQIEGSNDNSSFTVLQSFAGSPYVYEPTRSLSYSATQYVYYRVAVRASNSNGDMIYNGGGSLSSPTYYYATGTNPGVPTGISVSASSSTALIYYTAPASSGSNTFSGAQVSTDLVNWSSVQSSPVLISVSPSSNYTAYVRSVNADGLVSSATSGTSFTTPAALFAPSGGSVTVTPSSGTAGTTTYTATASGWSGNPNPTYTYSWQYLSYSFSWIQVATGSTFSPGATFNALYPNYGVQVVVTATNSQGSATASSSFTLTSPQYTVNYNGNGGTTPTASTVNAGVSVTLPSSTRSGYSLSGWYTASIGGTYLGTAGSSYTPSGSVTIYAQWTVAFTTPTCVAPSLQFLRTASTSRLDWYCDYPTPSGSVASISGMQFEIRTTAGGGTLLASGTRAYPGAATYPYSAAGTVWAFRMGTANGDIVYSASARYGRARVVINGTDGGTYYGTWSGWL